MAIFGGHEERWQRIAEAIRGELRPKEAFWRRYRSIDAQRGYTVVRVNGWPVDKYGLVRIRLRAPFLLPCGPRLRLLTQGTLRMWLRGFGYQDIAIGHSRFDLDVTVKGSPAEQVIETLLPVADRILSLDKLGALRTTAREVRASFRVAVEDVSPLRAFVDIVGAIANTDYYGLDVLEGLTGVEIVAPSEPGPPRFRLRVPSPVELGVELVNGALSTVARAENRSDDLRTSADLAEVGADASKPLVRLRRRVEGARLAVEDERIVLYWDRLCSDADELGEAAALLAALSRSATTGAYR